MNASTNPGVTEGKEKKGKTVPLSMLDNILRFPLKRLPAEQRL